MVSSYLDLLSSCCTQNSFRSTSPRRTRCNLSPCRHASSNPNNLPEEAPILINTNNVQNPTRIHIANNARPQTPTSSINISSTIFPAGSSPSVRSLNCSIEGSTEALKKRMISLRNLTTTTMRKPDRTIRIRASRKGKEKAKERSEQQDEEWYMVKKITPGHRNRIPSNDDDSDDHRDPSLLRENTGIIADF